MEIEKREFKNKEQARDYAIDWQNWSSQVSMSWVEVQFWSETFNEIGEKWGLLKEFKENGII